jgi:hypothetical protein
MPTHAGAAAVRPQIRASWPTAQLHQAGRVLQNCVRSQECSKINQRTHSLRIVHIIIQNVTLSDDVHIILQRGSRAPLEPSTHSRAFDAEGVERRTP